MNDFSNKLTGLEQRAKKLLKKMRGDIVAIEKRHLRYTQTSKPVYKFNSKNLETRDDSQSEFNITGIDEVHYNNIKTKNKQANDGLPIFPDVSIFDFPENIIS